MSETTSEQLAEIEGQQADTPATEYTLPEGWQEVPSGEPLKGGDEYHAGLNRYIRPIEPQPQPQPDPQSEPVPEPEPQAADTAATEYTPPDGWRLLAVGELVMLDDQWVRQDGSVWRSMGTEGPVSEGARYIRRIEPEPVWVCEGRWRTRGGDIKNIRPCKPLKGAYYVWPWTDGFMTFQDNGRHQGSQESPSDLVEYLGPIEQKPQPQPPMLQDADERIRLLKQANNAQAETIERLQTEARDLNMEIGGLERRLSERDARIRDLETIYSAATKSFEDANKANDALRAQVRILQREADKKDSRIEFLETLNAGNGAAIGDYRAQVEKLQGLVDTARGQLETAATEHYSLSTQLAAVKAELVTQAETSRRLQIELDAAQQVPADSPELRQLRADLAEVIRERDQYRHCYDEVSSHLETIEKTAKAKAVEAIVEWLEPIKGAIDAADNQDELARAGFFAIDTIRHLPAIMRSLTGLEDEDIE